MGWVTVLEGDAAIQGWRFDIHLKNNFINKKLLTLLVYNVNIYT